MKREGGLWATAAVLGVAATVGISTTKTTQPSPTTAASNTAKSYTRPSTPGMEALDNGPCPDMEKLLQAFFLIDETEIAAPRSCYPDAKQPPPNSTTFPDRVKQLHFVIATLPDPLHTHFPLIFDRSAEAIEEAAQDDGYVYDSSWLPWETDESSYPRIDDQDQAEKRKEEQEDQPGILLFRKSLRDQNQNAHSQPFEDGLAVLIVGEEPTGGIHRRQFENAVEWIAALEPSDSKAILPPIQILGPSFSGSIPSLVELLRSKFDILANRAGSNLRIFSGSVTSNTGVDWLQKAAADDLGRLNIQFRSFQHSGDVDLDRYCRYVYAAGTDPATLAIVSEDETAYGAEYNIGNARRSPCRTEQADETSEQTGAAKKPPKEGPVYLYYPRDIAALRAAYQSQSIFTRATGQPGGDTSRHVLQSDLADPEGKDHDTIRSYSGDQTALSQEAELQQMVSLMRAHRTQYILLRSSNPLDQLFLSHFFRLTYPQGRIVLVGSDLLLRRETGASGLNGVMTLTTYPLLPWEQDWTRPLAPGPKPPFLDTSQGKFHSHRVFTNDGVEGTYVAARFLLHLPLDPDPGKEITSDRALAATAIADGEESANHGFVPSNCDPDLSLPDYAAPFWMRNPREAPCRHPPTWLSVLGDGGFWPVAAMDFPTDLGKKNPPTVPDLNEKELLTMRVWHSLTSICASVAFFFTGTGVAGDMPQAWLAMPPSMKLLMLAGLFWAFFHALCCGRASITVKPAHRAYFVRPNCTSNAKPSKCDAAYLKRQQNSHRSLILFGSILVALLPITLAWGYGEMWEGGEPLPDPWLYRAFLPLVWLIAGIAVCANAWVEQDLFERNDPPASRSNLWQSLILGIRAFAAWTKKGKVPAAVRRSLLTYTGVSLVLYWLLDFSLDRALNDTNRVPTYWRAINLTTGVSPLVPLVSLIAGLYGWFWYGLQGLALFGEDRPQLPATDSLTIIQPKQQGQPERKDDLLQMLSKEGAGQWMEELSSPFAPPVWIVAALCFLGLIAGGGWLFGFPPIRNLGSRAYSFVFCLWLVLSISILLANAWQLSRVWLRLRHMLQSLDKLPLRRTLGTFKGYSCVSLWKMSGNVLDVRYKLVFRQMESLNHLHQSLLEWQEKPSSGLVRLALGKRGRKIDVPAFPTLIKAIEDTRSERLNFAQWYSLHWDDWKARRMSGIKSLQQSLAATAGLMVTQLLLPTWREESQSLALDLPGKTEESGKDTTDTGAPSATGLPPHIRNAEELVCFVYMAFIQNILGRMRSLVMGMICVFISITIAVASYPFDPRPVLSGIVVALFVILSAVIVAVYSQMHRDTTLSYITDTKPGELGSDFWGKLIGFGAGPVLGLVASVFPEFTGFIFSWIQPGIASIK
jgi:hypothetical protein